MEATNYMRTVIELSKRGGSPIPPFFRVKAATAHIAPKFALPFGGRLFSHNLSDMPTPVRLPYPMVVLEFPVHEYPLRPLLEQLPEENRADNLDDDKGRDRMIVIATQEGDEPITLVTVHRILGTDSWSWAPFSVAIASKREITPENPTGLWLAVNKRYPTGSKEEPLSESWMSHVAGHMMKSAMYAVYDLVYALGGRADVHTIEGRKLNRSARRRGALPFDTYRVLTIRATTEPKAEPTLPSGEPSDRPSPREHERRGHWRTYKSGKRRWIEKMTVNPGVGGKVIKDYEVKL